MDLGTHHVVVQTAFLGDLFLSIPLLKKIRINYPNDRIILVCKKGLGDYFINENLVDSILEVKKNNRFDYGLVKKALNKIKVKNLICVHRSIRSQLFCWQIKADMKIGFNSYLGRFIFNKLVKFQSTWPEALRQLWILSALDLKLKQDLQQNNWAYLNQVQSGSDLNLLPTEFSNSLLITSTSKKIALFPGSVWATKKWTESGFAEVGLFFISKGYEIFLMGGLDEREICENIKSKLPSAQVIAGQKSILESVEFIKTCALVICNDSAPTHMAASVNTPVVVIFGPTTLDLGFRPWSDKAKIVQNINLNCRPCGKHGHQLCPLGHHRCMVDIKSDAVINAALLLLKLNH